MTLRRTKTTVYVDAEVLHATRVSVARRGKRASDIIEDALRRYLGLVAPSRPRPGVLISGLISPRGARAEIIVRWTGGAFDVVVPNGWWKRCVPFSLGRSSGASP